MHLPGHKGKRPARDVRESVPENYRVLHRSAGQLLGAIGTGFLWMTAADLLFYRRLLAMPFLLPLLLIWLRLDRSRVLRQRMETIETHFGQALGAISVSLGAGLSVEHAFREAERELVDLYGEGDILTTEFRRLNVQLSCHIPPETLLLSFADRTGVEEIENFAEIFAASRKSGGNLREIIRRTASVMERKIQVEKEIGTILSAKRAEFRLMCLMPAAVILYMQLASPGFLDVLYETAAGAVFMTMCLAVYLAAILWGQKMIRIEI